MSKLFAHNNVKPSASSEKKRLSDRDQVELLKEFGLLNDDRPRKRAPGPPSPVPNHKNASITNGTIAKGNTPGSSTSTLHPAGEPTHGGARSKQQQQQQQQRTGGGAAKMAGMLDADRSRSRKERTFVGSECAVCEEPLEHTLRGERILQFSCAHVSHEACFYEYIKEFDSQFCPTCNAPLGLDTSRGGNVLDIEKLTNIVRSVSANDSRSQTTPTPTGWDNQASRPHSSDSNSRGPRPDPAQGYMGRDNRESRERMDRYASNSRSHTRNNSENTAMSSAGYTETSHSGPPRRHEYDVQSVETGAASPRSSSKPRNPIPPPVVSVRSEFPTLTRSKQQQTLTCLVTIEVPDQKWQADPEDARNGGGPPVPALRAEQAYPQRPPSPARSAPRFLPYESAEILDEITENLRVRVENWHGLDFSRFGKLRLYGTIKVGKDKQAWQELECYLFAEMLICVKEKKNPNLQQWEEAPLNRKTGRCTLKGSILIKKHLNEVTESSGREPGQTEKITAANLRSGDDHVLTLSLSVQELPSFHLKFESRNQLKLWQQALADLNAVEHSPMRSPDYDTSETDEEDWHKVGNVKRVSSLASSYGASRSVTTAPTEYTGHNRGRRIPPSLHVPVDIVVVIPTSSSMQGVKINLVRDALRFMVHNMGERDRMGLVTFGSSTGATPLVGMTAKSWQGWVGILSGIRPNGQKNPRADVVEGANVAMDLLMQRKSSNPIGTILLISDSSTSESESVDFVVSRAEAAKIAIHSFGLGMTHKPDTMIELSTRTKASYTYVKDWMMLRECVAGCLGALQTISHQNVKLKLRLPEGSPAKFVKISGALQITKRATGKDAEASLGDLRFGDKRDVLVQLVIAPDNSSQENLPQDPWESIVSGLEALGGSLEQEETRVVSVEEVPLIQADLTWGDIQRDAVLTQLPRPSLLAITMLPAANSSNKKSSYANSPPIPPHPSVVQRRMELLTSDMLTRALTLVSRGQHDRAQHLLNETRSILKGLGKGGLPPIPPTPSKSPNVNGMSNGTSTNGASSLNHDNTLASPSTASSIDRQRTPSPVSATTAIASQTFPTSSMATASAAGPRHIGSSDTLSAGIDAATVAALDAELESSLEWINHPAVFGRDSRKAVLQAIGVISSQRGYTFRTPVEGLWASRVRGVKRCMERSREWREEGGGEMGIREET